MTTTSSNQKSFVFAGLAGETAPGRRINSGLYRMSNDDGQWSMLTNGLPESPAVRAIAVHPKTPEVVYAGTQDGPYRSGDHGDHWEKVNVGDHGLPVWSLLFHPRNPNVVFAGYESSEIYRSDDGGERWTQLPVSVRFPEVTVRPGANLAKRVLMMSATMDDPGLLYGAIEVGGIIRSKDGGEHWENLSHGQYVNDDPVTCTGSWPAASAQGIFSASAGPECSGAKTRAITGTASESTPSTRRVRLIAGPSVKHRGIPGTFGCPEVPTSRAILAASSTVPTAARTGGRWKPDSRPTAPYSGWPSTAAIRATCTAPPAAARYSAAGTAARVGVGTRSRKGRHSCIP